MISDEIRRLHELHQAGALTTEEFEQAKAKVLAGATPNERVNLNKDGASMGNGFEARPGFGARDFKSLRRSRTDRWLGASAAGWPAPSASRPGSGAWSSPCSRSSPPDSERWSTFCCGFLFQKNK